MSPVAYGALRGFLDGDKLRDASGVNPHLLLSRLWVGAVERGALSGDPALRYEHLRAVADAAKAVPEALLSSLHARRKLMASRLAGQGGDRVAAQLTITPEWRVVVGHGETSIHETSLSLSPVYGVPVWPGSGLKGAAAAAARSLDRWRDRPDVARKITTRVFGSPRPGERDTTARQGEAIILDALPLTPPELVVDVLTPHVSGYYREVNSGAEVISTPPAEYHNPIPVHFLAVERTAFHTTVIGTKAAVEETVELLEHAVKHEGLGGKTSAGYGYCQVEELL